MQALPPEATMAGYPSRRAPLDRKTYSMAACTWYSRRPGRVKRMASAWPSALISQAVRRRAASSGVLRSRISASSGEASRTSVGVTRPNRSDSPPTARTAPITLRRNAGLP